MKKTRVHKFTNEDEDTSLREHTLLSNEGSPIEKIRTVGWTDHIVRSTELRMFTIDARGVHFFHGPQLDLFA